MNARPASNHLLKPSLVEIPEAPAAGGNLPDRIYSHLKRCILSGKIAPGEHLLEKALCDALKVSRTPLREALNRLGNEDLVIFRPHCGFIVAPISSEGFRRLLDLRIIIESKVAVLACMRAGPADIEALRNAAVMPALDGGEKSFIDFCQANARFHLLLVRATGNNLLENIVMSALDQYQRPAYLGIGRVTDHEKATRCHLDLVEALEAREALKAESVMSHHVLGGFERIIRALVEAGL